MSNGPPHPRELCVHNFRLEHIVEVPSGPSNELLVLLMLRVENYFQELLLTVDPANILRWTAAFATKADRVR